MEAALQTDLRLQGGAVGPGQRRPDVPVEFRLPAEGRLFLVQFRTIGLSEWQEELTDLGAEVRSKGLLG